MSESSGEDGELVKETFEDLARLAVASLASFLAARIGSRLFALPQVLTYILLGIGLGPHALALLDSQSVAHLWFVRDTALVFIGFVAGNELVLRELDKPKALLLSVFKGILSCIVVVSPLTIIAGKLGIPWLSELPTTTLVAAALVLGVLAAARAPSVTIAVARELRARGPFTQSVVPVVVAISIAVLIVFAVNNAICDGLLRGKFEVTDLANVLILLTMSCVLAAIMALLATAILSVRNVMPRIHKLKRSWRAQIRSILRIGGLLFIGFIPAVLHRILDQTSLGPKAHGIKLSIDLLTCGMCAGLVVVNWTPKRLQFTHTLNASVPYIFAVFFVLTGVGLDISVLARTWSLVPFIFVLRLLALFLGHFLTWRSRFTWKHRALLWLGHVAQGGVSASLITQLPHVLPTIGPGLAAIAVGVLVLNTICGPLSMKIAIRALGEDGKLAANATMVIVGCDMRSLLFASRILRSGWSVVMIDMTEERIADARDNHPDVFFGAPLQNLRWLVLPQLTSAELSGLGVKPTDCLVCALPTDDNNYALAKAAVELGLSRVLVRLHDPANTARFFALNVLVLDMTSALLDFANMAASSVLDPLMNVATVVPGEAAPSPSETSRLLAGAAREVRTVKVVDPLEDHFGQAVKDLVWPQSVFVSAIIRGSAWIEPTPSTQVVPGDKLVIVGRNVAMPGIVGDESPFAASLLAAGGSAELDSK